MYIYIQAHYVATGSDHLAGQAMGATVESTSALRCCRFCDFMTNHGGKRHDRPTNILGTPRTLKSLSDLLEVLREGNFSAAQLKKLMQGGGINKLFYALDPAYVPNADATQDLPGDLMHLFFCGITRHELAWLIDIFLKNKYFTLDQLNERLKLLRLPYGKSIPSIQPQTANKKRRDMNLDLTASETMYFAKASIVLFEGLLPPAALLLPCCFLG